MRNAKAEIGGSALCTLQSAIDTGEGNGNGEARLPRGDYGLSSDLGPLSAASRLALLLLPFGIRPRTMRIGTLRLKGYDLADFAEAFARFVKDPPQASGL